MIRVVLSLIMVILSFNVNASIPLIDSVRSSFGIAVADKNVCSEMIDKLEHLERTPLITAYLGGFQTIWANHIASPLEKLKTFKKGRKNIERAVHSDPDNVEIRFIRLSIQHRAPGILGYHSNVNEDAAFLRKHRAGVMSEILGAYIDKILNDLK